MTTIYNHNGLRAELVDNEAIVIYLEGVATVGLTIQEWRNINAELTAMEEVE